MYDLFPAGSKTDISILQLIVGEKITENTHRRHLFAPQRKEKAPVAFTFPISSNMADMSGQTQHTTQLIQQTL